MHTNGESLKAKNYAIGYGLPSKITLEMRAVMVQNSMAVEEMLTSKVRDSAAPLPIALSCAEKKDATAEVR